MIQDKNKKIILCTLGNSNHISWREGTEYLKKMEEKNLALDLSKIAADERREMFREFESIANLSFPVVIAAVDMETWEFDYLLSRHASQFFVFLSEPRYFTFAVTLQKYKEHIIFENPSAVSHSALFTDEALTRATITGVCLNLGTLEFDRLRHKKKYQSSVHTLDHHSLKVTRISPFPSAWWQHIIFLHPRRLKNLKDLHYVKNVPANYFADYLIIDADNTLDEQKEIKEYIGLLLG